MYLDQLQPKVSQGDIFDSLPLSYVEWALPPQPALRFVRAILLTYDCEYDKPSCTLVLVAEVKPLSLVPENGRGNVRKNHVARSFYLPSQGTLESVMNFDSAHGLFMRLAAIKERNTLVSAQVRRKHNGQAGSK